MKRLHVVMPLIVLSALVIAFTLEIAFPRAAQGQTGIIVDGAKQVRSEGLQYGGIPGGVALHVVLDSAETKREERVVAPSGVLQGLFAQVPVRVVLEAAETMRPVVMGIPPAELRTRLGAVALRLVLESAETGRQISLAYPLPFFNDQVPPVIRDVRVRSEAGGLRVLWETDEFATSEVRFGTAPGVYGPPIVDPLYTKQHGVILTAVTPGQTYYLVASSVDRSGNRSTSGETQAKPLKTNFLPLVLRR